MTQPALKYDLTETEAKVERRSAGTNDESLRAEISDSVVVRRGVVGTGSQYISLVHATTTYAAHFTLSISEALRLADALQKLAAEQARPSV